MSEGGKSLSKSARWSGHEIHEDLIGGLGSTHNIMEIDRVSTVPRGSVFDVAREREDKEALLNQPVSEADKEFLRKLRAWNYVKLTFIFIGLCALTIGASYSIPNDPAAVGAIGFTVLALLTNLYGWCWLIQGAIGMVCSLIWRPRSRLFLYLLGLVIGLSGLIAVNVIAMSLKSAVSSIGARGKFLW